jgi:pyruvate/2-oxoglutarate/acetoin dehydrogenase E1 component
MSKDLSYLEAIREALVEEMRRDPKVFVLGEDVGAYGGAFKVTEGLLDRFGERRVIDTPISEVAIVGSAIGASYTGMRPVCEVQFIDFIACCFDMLTNFAATSRYRNGAGVPIVVRGPSGGGVGGGPFHSLNPESFFLNTPGLKMVEPATAYDAKGLLKAAIRDDDPVLFFEHKFLYRRIKDEVPDGDYVVPIGNAAVRREGRDLSIITFGAMMHTALDAAARLAAEGVEAEVVDLRSLAPLDREAILTSVSKTSRALLLHEATLTGGIGGELAAIIAEDAFEYLDAPITRVASADTPVPYSPPLEAAFLPNVEKVVAAAKKLVEY